MRTIVLALGLAIGGGPDAVRSKDPCTLLTPAEIQTLTPTIPVGTGASSAVNASLGSFACEYKWKPSDNARVHYALQILLSDASKTFPGASPDYLKRGLLRGAKVGGANARVINGIGEAAIYESNGPIRAKATAYVNDLLLSVNFEGPDARTKKDQVITLLKLAAGRL